MREVAAIVRACKAVPAKTRQGYCDAGGLDFAVRLEAFSRRVSLGALAVRESHPWGTPGYDAAMDLGVSMGRALSQAGTAMTQCTGQYSGPEAKREDQDSVAHSHTARACVLILGARQMWPREFGEAFLRSSSREL